MSASPDAAWDVTTDPANPVPLVFPVCATCETPWVWRRGISFGSGGYVWAWTKDCKHTPREGPVLMTKDGPYEPEPAS